MHFFASYLFIPIATRLLCRNNAIIFTCNLILLPNLLNAAMKSAPDKDDIEERFRTAYLYADYGLGTYKSTLMDNNDTNGIMTYGVGLYAGQNKQLGVDYRVEQATTTFALNSSSLQMKYESTSIRYRLWLFELGPVIGSVTGKGNRAGTDIFDAVGSGYGGFFGFYMPVGRRNLLHMSLYQVSTGTPIDKKGADIQFGPRQDLEVGTYVNIVKKYLDINVGYRRRSHSITEGGTTYAELQTETYLGFMTGFSF
jgi:hypothetical protein